MSLAELICPAGTPAALRTAVDAGADAVYCGFQDATNARNFPGLNFTPEELAQCNRLFAFNWTPLMADDPQ